MTERLDVIVDCSFGCEAEPLGRGPETLARLAQELLPTPSETFLEALSSVYTYMYLYWKRIMLATRMEFSSGHHTCAERQDRPCFPCIGHKQMIDWCSQRLASQGPKALSLAVKMPVSWDVGATERVMPKGLRNKGLLTLLYKGWDLYPHYIWPQIYTVLTEPTCNMINIWHKAPSTIEQGITLRVWGSCNSVWKMLADRMTREKREIHHGDRNHWSHERWEFTGPALRGWVFWDEERVQSLGWTDAETVGWIAQVQPGWRDGDEKGKRLALKKCAELITRASRNDEGDVNEVMTDRGTLKEVKKEARAKKK